MRVRKAGRRPGRGSELYVQPTELARKLVKEMEDHKVSRATHVSVRNRYTIYLCPEDYERLRGRKDALIVKLQRHLAKHVRSKGYDLHGDLGVALVVDEDLSLGHFGILAERDVPGVAERGLPSLVEEAASFGGGRVEAFAPVESAPAPTRAMAPVLTQRPRAEAPRSAGGSAGRTRGGATEIIAPNDAARMGLALQTLVLKSGDREREFTQGRVIVGRAKDVDFRVDDPNVSRQHAAVFWSEGRVVVEDLGSTNGTLVNGHPVSSTVVRPGDVVVIGDCHFTVETR